MKLVDRKKTKLTNPQWEKGRGLSQPVSELSSPMDPASSDTKITPPDALRAEKLGVKI